MIGNYTRPTMPGARAQSPPQPKPTPTASRAALSVGYMPSTTSVVRAARAAAAEQDTAARAIQTAQRIRPKRSPPNPPPPAYVIAPSKPAPVYEQLDGLPVMLNGHLEKSIPVGTNLFPYAELLHAKDAMREMQLAEREERKRKLPPKPMTLNLAQREERELRKAVETVRTAQYELILTEIAARDVPDADADAGWSDPYLGFSVMHADGSYDELHHWQLDACTAPIRNAKNPRWKTPLKLWIPPGSAASLHAASQVGC